MTQTAGGGGGVCKKETNTAATIIMFLYYYLIMLYYITAESGRFHVENEFNVPIALSAFRDKGSRLWSL